MINLMKEKRQMSEKKNNNSQKLKLVIPKGRMYEQVMALLNECGYDIKANGRSYRPRFSDEDFEIKILKPQNIGKLVEMGSHDIGFSGKDWIIEKDADVIDLIDLNFDPVRLVAAIPKEITTKELKSKKIIVASEYEKIAKEFCDKEGLDYYFLQTYGATEVFPPEDADMIIDNTATGTTLRQNGLSIYKDILTSSTRLVANKEAMQDPWKKKKIDELLMLIRGVLEGRKRVMLEMNISEKKLQKLIDVLPCMKSPTINKLYKGGYAVKAAVPRKDLPKIIPLIKKSGATDILEFEINKVVV